MMDFTLAASEGGSPRSKRLLLFYALEADEIIFGEFVEIAEAVSQRGFERAPLQLCRSEPNQIWASQAAGKSRNCI
jgi:hypothetical protein